MEKRDLGASGIKVSRLCYGTLPFSSSQCDMSYEEGGELLEYSFGKGIDFIDTAEMYKTYPHIKNALRRVSRKPVISTKSYAYDEKGARESLEKARREMDVDTIDVFLIHEQVSLLTMLGHKGAMEYYISMRDKGVIGAVGISTHAVQPLAAIAKAKNKDLPDLGFKELNEFDAGIYREVDVVHPILNMKGLGVMDADGKTMHDAARACSREGVGVFGMKILGGGNLLKCFDQAMDYALCLDFVHSFAVGMQNFEEIDMNVSIFSGKMPDGRTLEKIKNKKRRLLVENWCTGCKSCVEACNSKAISVKNGKAVPDGNNCVLCGYCANACEEFAIRVI